MGEKFEDDHSTAVNDVFGMVPDEMARMGGPIGQPWCESPDRLLRMAVVVGAVCLRVRKLLMLRLAITAKIATKEISAHNKGIPRRFLLPVSIIRDVEGGSVRWNTYASSRMLKNARD